MITREIGRACRKAKRDFIRNGISERDWDGIRPLKSFRAQQARIKNPAGQVLPAGQRAQTKANFFRDKVWGPADLDGLPERPYRYPDADMTTNAFTADELRAAGRSLKTGRTAGTDDVENEFLQIMLSTALGFTLLLSLFCHCWETKSMPTAFDLARIVAVYKTNGKDTGYPDKLSSYRSAANLLQIVYDAFAESVEAGHQ